MKKRFAMVFAALLFVVAGCNRKDENIVAEVNGEKIFAREFAERYRAYMTQGGQRDNILLRQKIMDNMINERLIYADCARQGFDSDASYRRKYVGLESQAIVDAYAKSISSDTITVSEQELQDEFKAFNMKVNARYLYAESEDAALQLKNALENGATFDSLAKEVFEDPGLANNGGNLGYFGWGEMEPAFEEVAYSLPKGKISDPIRMKVGFGILQVLNRVSNPLPSELDYAKAKEKLSRAVIQKKTLRLITQTGHQLAEDLHPQFDGKIVAQILGNWRFIADDKLFLEQHSVLRDTLKDRALVNFRNRSWTVADFLERAMRTTTAQRRRVKTESDVMDFVKGLALREELLSRAREAGMADNEKVHAEIKKARESYLLKRWMLSVRDTVGQSGWDEAAMKEQFLKFKKEYAFPPEVKVAEILVRSKYEAEKIAQRIKRGGDFSNLAQQFSLRRSTAKSGGEIGWGTMGTFGNLGQKFVSSNVGQIIGPEFVDPYFGIFKILDKNTGRLKTFEEAKDQIAAALTSSKRTQVISEAVSALRSRAKVNVDNEMLANISIN